MKKNNKEKQFVTVGHGSDAERIIESKMETTFFFEKKRHVQIIELVNNEGFVFKVIRADVDPEIVQQMWLSKESLICFLSSFGLFINESSIDLVKELEILQAGKGVDYNFYKKY